MKKNLVFNAAIVAAFLLCVFCSSSIFAQRYLTERKPDLVLKSVSVKRSPADAGQLLISYSIQNIGDETALEFNDVVGIRLESSNKLNQPGVLHNWVPQANRADLNTGKKELKPGETLTGSTLIPFIEQDNLISLRVSLDINNDFYESKKENNSLITAFIRK